MSLVSKNNVVACQPFEQEQAKAVNTKKLAVVGQKSQLVELFVRYGTEIGDEKYVGENDVIFVRASCLNLPWAKEKFTFQGVENSAEFILVPVGEIVLIDRDAMKDCCDDDVCNDCRAKEEAEAKAAAAKKEPPKAN